MDQTQCPAEARPPLGGGARAGLRVRPAGAGGGARPCPRGQFLEDRGGSEKWLVRATPWNQRTAIATTGAAQGRVSQLWASKLQRWELRLPSCSQPWTPKPLGLRTEPWGLPKRVGLNLPA